MEQTIHPAGLADPASFAGLLASLATPQRRAQAGDGAWNDDALGNDVVTLSYEQALRNHGRYRQAERGSRATPVAAYAKPAGKLTVFEADSAPCGDERVNLAEQVQTEQAGARELRTACVSIWMSKAERAQLRRRAGEAGLTLSAYLRLCALEADALREQVKQALAELKTAAAADGALAPVRGRWPRWLGRITRLREKCGGAVEPNRSKLAGVQ